MSVVALAPPVSCEQNCYAYNIIIHSLNSQAPDFGPRFAPAFLTSQHSQQDLTGLPAMTCHTSDRYLSGPASIANVFIMIA